MSTEPTQAGYTRGERELRFERRLQRAALATLDESEREIVERIAGMDDVGELAALVDEIGDSDRLRFAQRKFAVADRLGELGTVEATAALGLYIKSADPDFAAVATRVLAEHGGEPAIPYLMEALEDPRDWKIRTHAAYGLAYRQHREAYPKIVAPSSQRRA